MKKITATNNLAIVFPELAKEWHPEKNEDLTPGIVGPHSRKKVWWICRKGHEWEAVVYSRSAGNGCPYCYGRYATKDNCLAKLFPDIAREWHPTKNGSLTPEDVKGKSSKKVWWKCKKGHEWEAQISDRAKGRGCPYCAGKKVCKDNCLATIYPKIAKEWNKKKNGKLKPKDVTAFSNKMVWWKCKKGHEWKSLVSNRALGCGCPYCHSKKVCKDNCLMTVNRNLALEWHPTLNGNLTPKDVLPYANKKVWWQCWEGHEWQAFIYSRSYGCGCPYCSGRRKYVPERIM